MRLAYKDRTLSVAEILKRFDIGSTKFYRLIREQNWTLRSLKSEKPNSVATSQSRSGKAAQLPLATLKRLRKIARQYVRELENENKRIDSDAVKGNQVAHSAAERERSVRSLRTLLKIIEEIADLEARFKSIAGKTGRKEIDHKQREELARRIKALRCKNR